MNLSVAPLRASSVSTFTKRETLTAEKSRSPSSSSTLVPSATAVFSSSSSSASLSRAPDTSGQSKPAFFAFFCTFSARHRAGRERATASSASVLVACPFSFRLSSSQLERTSPVPETDTSPKTWGWRKMSFLQMPSATASRSKRPASCSMRAWNTTWSNTSPNSSFRCSGLPSSMASTAS